MDEEEVLSVFYWICPATLDEKMGIRTKSGSRLVAEDDPNRWEYATIYRRSQEVR